MNKEQYEQIKKDIIAEYGTPTYDMRDPVNESAKRITAARSQYLSDAMAIGRANKYRPKEEQQKDNSIQGILKDVPKERIKATWNIDLPEMCIDDKYLLAFDDTEKKILHTHFNQPNLKNKDIGIKFNVSAQLVTSLLNDTRTKILEARLFESLAPWRTRLALLRLVESNDSRVVVRLAEHFKVIESESKDINLITKPIQDTEAEKMLKEIGDKLIEKERP